MIPFLRHAPLFLLMACLFPACGSSSDSPSANNGVRLKSAADFAVSASALHLKMGEIIKDVTTGVCADLGDLSQDDPILADGLDCDGDGGGVGHITPARYAIAFKRLSLIPAIISGEAAAPGNIDFISDKGTLVASQEIDFTGDDLSETIATIEPSDLEAGTYSGIEAEIYYFQLTFPVGGTERNVRIYMSDDDFVTEGRLGHHQGDITFIDTDGEELGWIDGTWSDALDTSRGEGQNGAGGTDAETGHDRGFFGNASFWNAAGLNQGATQDIFVTTFDFDENLAVPDPDTITDLTTITLTFSVADTFFYEDFAPQGTGFSPGSGGEATSEGAAWAPLAPTAAVAVSEGE